MQAINAITQFIFVENEPQQADIIFLPGGPGTAPPCGRRSFTLRDTRR